MFSKLYNLSPSSIHRADVQVEKSAVDLNCMKVEACNTNDTIKQINYKSLIVLSLISFCLVLLIIKENIDFF